MSKKLAKLAVAGGILGVAAVAEIAVHAYLDVVYNESIPPGIFKRYSNRQVANTMGVFREYTERCREWIRQQDIEEIDITSTHGYNIKGYLLPSENPSDIFVIFGHGYRSDHMGDPANFEKYYHDKGFNFLSIDHTTCGGSGGKFVGFDYFESDDMMSWVEYLINRFGKDIKIILHGVSMGGASVCKCASRVPDQVKMIISDCAYTSATNQFISVAEGLGLKKTGPVLVKIIDAMNKRFAGYSLEDTDVLPSVTHSRVPMLFVHGGADDFVPTDMVYVLYGACSADKDLLIIDGAGHAQSIMGDTEKYLGKLDEFIGERL